MSATRQIKRRNGGPRMAVRTALAAGFMALCTVVFVIVLNSPKGLPGVSYYTLEAEFADLSGLASQREIRIGGSRVGRVLDARVEDGRALIDVQLKGSVPRLLSDTEVVIRSKGLIGDRFLDIRPGTEGEVLEDGAQIPLERGSATVTLPEALEAFDPTTRKGLRRMVTEFGGGTLGRGGDINDLLRDSPELFTDLRKISREVLAEGDAASRLVPAIRDAAAAAEPVREEIAKGFDPAARALRPFGDKADELKAALSEAPQALISTRIGLAKAAPLLSEARRLARIGAEVLPGAPRGLRETAALLDEADQPLRLTTDLLGEVRPIVGPFLGLAHDLTPLLPRTGDVFGDSLPLVDELGSRGCDILEFGRNWRSMLENGIPGGGELGNLTALRLLLLSGTEAGASFNDPLPEAYPIGRNPYPAPCEAGTEQLP